MNDGAAGEPLDVDALVAGFREILPRYVPRSTVNADSGADSFT